MNLVAEVCIPKTKHDYYDYLVLDKTPKIGSRVKVSFHKSVRFGIVIGLKDKSLFTAKLKPILEVLEDHLITPDLLKFYQWIAQYYHASLSAVMTLALPKKYKQGELLNVTANASARAKLVSLTLNNEQQMAVYAVLNKQDSYHAFLLQGVTGSGKTEVYLELIEHYLSLKKQILVLVPEIGLTPQLVQRFLARLKEPLVVIHSHLNDKERYSAWVKAALGQAALVLGTRTALFTPMPNLGLIVIDEEHDASFKQQEGVKYSARDCAIIRAKLCNLPIILGSATPSLESYHNAETKKFTRLVLSNKALDSALLNYEVVDLRAKTLVDGLANITYQRIEKHLKQGNQVLVFINRRGFAPVCLCHVCGWMADCAFCDRHYTVHKKTQRLICHHCGSLESLPSKCKLCASTDLIWLGEGTQRLYKALVERFPNVVTRQIDRDELRKKNALNDALEDIAKGKTKLMVGTQLLAKGHHFPLLTLVVVVDADAGFYNQDFRSLERLGQLLLQVAGRAGRADLQGEVLIQTHLPQHPLLNILIKQGYDAFARTLLTQRYAALLPPYIYMGIIFAKGRDLDKVSGFLHLLKQHLRIDDLKIYGPAPAMMPKKAGLYRMQLCLMSAKRQILHTALSSIGQKNVKATGVKWHIDVDPMEVG